MPIEILVALLGCLSDLWEGLVPLIKIGLEG